MITISFIVTCLNEEKNVIGAVEKIHNAAVNLNLTHEILIFDDASTDNTSKVIKEYMQAYPEVPIKLYRNEINKGVAYNFLEGAFHAKGEYCRLICGDDIESLETHTTILSNIGKADIILPFHREIKGRSLLRHCISKMYVRVINLISGFSIKYYNGFPIFKRFDVQRWHIEATGLGFQAEFIIRLLRQNKTYIEVPIDAIHREGSVSFRFKNIISVCYSITKIFLSRLRLALYNS